MKNQRSGGRGQGTDVRSQKSEHVSPSPRPQPLSTPREHLIRPPATFSPSDAEKGNRTSEGGSAQPEGQRLLRRWDVAERLQVSLRTVSKLVAAGKLRPIRLQKRIVRFRAADVESLASGEPSQARGAA